MRFPHAPLLLLALSSSWLPAQAVTSSAVMGGATVSAQAGGNPPQVRTIAPGSPLPAVPVVAIQTANGTALSVLSGSLTSLDTRVTLTLQTSTYANGSGAASVVADALLTIAVPSPVPVRVDLTSASSLASGASVPVLGVDLDNNGTIDLRGRVNTTMARLSS